MKITPFHTLAFLVIHGVLLGQAERWAPDKPGAWRYETNIPAKGYHLKNAQLTQTESSEFKKNVARVAEWFRQNHPMLSEPRGYDMRALSNYTWSDYSTITDGEYGIPADLGFLFELFFRDGKKWKVEPPSYRFSINSISGGHHGWYFTPDSVSEDSGRFHPSQAKAVQKARERLVHYFPAFPLIEQPFPGINIYRVNADGWVQITVFNPNRPPHWIPVLVKEIVDASLDYYSLFQITEMDRMIFAELKKEIAKLSPEDLASPAYMGHDSNIVLKINARQGGLQIMRFNPEYWDRSLPRSAIQFMAFWDMRLNQATLDDQYRSTGHPNYPDKLVRTFKWNEMAILIDRKGK